MLKNKYKIGYLLIILLLAACASPTVTSAPAAQPTQASQPTAAPTEASQPTTAPTQASEATAAPTMAAPSVEIQVEQSSTLGSYLADQNGKTLYLFTSDNQGASTCYDTCAQNWPALIDNTAPMAMSGVDASKLGTTTRTDGSVQVTYNGWPLYYFAKDTQPGDTNGEGLLGKWYVISPAGDQVAASMPEPTTAAASVEIQVEQSSTLGSYLADENGKTLYLFTPDNQGVSTCYDTCAQNWPALIDNTAPMAMSGVDASKLGTTTRTDGTVQVTYNGWPLYYFAKDAQPGDTNGEGLLGKWYVISPSGDQVTASAPQPQSSNANEGDY